VRDGVVVDTNVGVVANGKTPQAGPECVCACIDRLLQVRETGLVLLDDRDLIFDEYWRHLSPSGQPGTGDMFFKWLWNNQENRRHCRKVKITPDRDREFAEFPKDADLARFDRDDRKFVAVSIASDLDPRILNASDTDWWHHREAFSRQGVTVEFLCPELMEGS